MQILKMFGKFNALNIIIIAECIILCLLLPVCFREKQMVASFDGGQLIQADADAVEYISSEIVLTPGVYQVCVYTDMQQQEQSITAEVDYRSGSFHALRGNAVKIFPNQDYVDFEVYVTDKISDAFITFSMDQSDIHNLDSVEVYKTSLGGRMLLFLLAVSFLILDFLIWWRKRLLNGKSDLQQLVIVSALAGAVFCVYFPYLTDYFIGGTDTLFHILRIEGLKETFLNISALPIRVQDYWLYGHGYAVSMFYGDLFFSFPAFLRIIGFPIGTAYKAFLFFIIAGTAGISYFSFFKLTHDRYVALFSTIGYVLIPYRIYCFYRGGLIGGCLGMAFMPLVCCGMYLLLTDDPNNPKYKNYKWYLIIGLSAILQSHLISIELTVLLVVLVCVLFWKKTFRKKTFLQLLETAGITLAVNCWFWLPIIYMLSVEKFNLATIHKEIQDGGMFFADLFQFIPNVGDTLESVEAEWKGLYDSFPIQIGIGIISTFVLYLFYLIYKMRKFRWKEGIFAVFSIITLCMCLRCFPWDALMKIPLFGGFISSLQFPTRWLMAAMVFCAMFEAFVFLRWKQEDSRWFKVSVGIIMGLTVASAVYQVNDIAFYGEPISLYTAENIGTTIVGGGEYLIEGDVLAFSAHEPAAEDGLAWSDYKKQGTDITLFVSNETDQECSLELPLIGYKGYAVESFPDGEELAWLTEERGAHGDLRLMIPDGYAGYIHVWYKGLPVFHAAELVSGVAVLGVIIFCLFRFCGRFVGGKTLRKSGKMLEHNV